MKLMRGDLSLITMTSLVVDVYCSLKVLILEDYRNQVLSFYFSIFYR